MTQEKELLLKDLCSRLPYGVKLLHIPSGEITVLEMMNCDAIDGDIHDMINNFQPFLRPMSSMTEEEKEELIKNFWGSDGIRDTIEEVDWYLSKHFDIRGLIEKGLAIEVTEKNNPYKD